MKAALLKRLDALEAVAKKGRTIVLVVLRDARHDGRTYLRFDDGGELVGPAAVKELARARAAGRLASSLAMVLWDVNVKVALGLERNPNERLAMEEAGGMADEAPPQTVDVAADEVGELAGQAVPEAQDATQCEGEADALTEDQELWDVAEAIEAGEPVELPTPPPEPTRTISWKDWM